MLNECLDYQFMAKAVAKSASRALGLLIVKSKTHGGFQHNIFTKLFDTLVWSVINYGSAIWGTREFSCISAVQNWAMRFYMGVRKYTLNDAVAGDMGWKPPYVKQWTNVQLIYFQTKIRDYFLYGDQSYSADLVPCCNSFYGYWTLHW